MFHFCLIISKYNLSNFVIYFLAKTALSSHHQKIDFNLIGEQVNKSENRLNFIKDSAIFKKLQKEVQDQGASLTPTSTGDEKFKPIPEVGILDEKYMSQLVIDPHSRPHGDKMQKEHDTFDKILAGLNQMNFGTSEKRSFTESIPSNKTYKKKRNSD